MNSSNWWNVKLTVFELTMHYKHEMIGICQRFQRNFEFTVFELTVPDLYVKAGLMVVNVNHGKNENTMMSTGHF